MIQKWNPDTKEYEPYSIPEDWTVILYADDMELPINCASCGKDMTYGEGYTSRQIHNSIGLGYPVCDGCYEVERK